VKRALELGINFFDTADMYSTGVSEEVTGRALRDFARREEVVLATKVYFPTNPEDPNARGNSRKHIMDAIDASLRRLGTDYVDLYQIHRWDYSTPIEETMEALHDVVKTGKARYIGASSMYAWQFSKALHVAEQNGWTRFISMQNHLNLIYREEEREMLPLCIDQGIGVLPWSPLARGFLTRPRQRNEAFPTTRAKSDTMSKEMYYRPEDYDVLERVVTLAEQRGVTPAQLALAWLLQKPGVAAPIIGASKMSHLEDAAASIKVELSESEVAQLDEPYRPHPVLGHS
jgi:aryl-alcohol dehydrogenase-like predicted oxidoreductase